MSAVKPRTFEDVIRDVKEILLCNGIQVFYGQQDPGIDDTGTPHEERRVAIVGKPIGFQGNLVIAFQGTIPYLCAMNLFQRPLAVSNPPLPEELEETPYILKAGSFCWGTMEAASRWPSKLRDREAMR